MIKNKDNLIIKYKDIVMVLELLVLLFFISGPFIFTMAPNFLGILGSLFFVGLDIAVINYLIKKNKQELGYMPENIYYTQLNNGLNEYRYVYYFWEKNKKDGCIKSLKENGVNAIYTKRLTLLRRVVYGTGV